MIDVLELNEKSKECVSDGLEFLTSHLTYGNALELTDRLIAAEKDAARYRWLKEQGRHDYDVDDFFDGSCDRIDAKVDEAMQCNGDEK